MKKFLERWIQAPQPSFKNVPAVNGVCVASDEDVEWVWTHTQDGSYVSGYEIIKKPKLRKSGLAGWILP